MSKWTEVFLEPDADLLRVYQAIEDTQAPYSSVHHFWDEPWNRDAFVLRIETKNGDLSHEMLLDALRTTDGVRELKPWGGVKGDEEMYGEAWPVVSGFFSYGSAVALTLRNMKRTDRLNANGKLVHCFLNAQGMDPLDEAKFALRFARERVRMWWRLRRP